MTPFRMAPLRWFLVFPVVLALAASGCKPAPQPEVQSEATPVPSPPPSMEFGAKMDVRVVEVESSGSVDPDPVKVKRKKQVVVWVLDGDGTIDVKFPGDNPFDEQPTCVGRFCFAVKPPAEHKEAKNYPYEVTVTMSGETTTADPDVEVIP